MLGGAVKQRLTQQRCVGAGNGTPVGKFFRTTKLGESRWYQHAPSAGSTFLCLMVPAIPRSHRVTPAGLPMSHPRGQCPLPHPTSADGPTVEERGCAVLDPFIKLLAHLP